ncbi:MAG: hypothetical protein V1808_03960 [Candidatus Daviesbacteria bacterium]
MLTCQLCQKGIRSISFSRHKKGSSGAGGNWALRAPITKKVQKPNLHTYMRIKLCTKCLRAMKKSTIKAKVSTETSPAQA